MEHRTPPTPRMLDALARLASHDDAVSHQAGRDLATALELPFKKGVMSGDIIGDIFQREFYGPGVSMEYPLDLLSPGTESEYVAYTIPSVGRIADQFVSGDYITLRTYDIGASLGYPLRYAEEGNYNVLARVLQVLEGMFVQKRNRDGWHVLLMSGLGRNLMVTDSAATAGVLSKKLIESAKTTMRRRAGGNSTSVDRGVLSRIYTSPEAMGDVRGWTLTEVDDFTRRQIFLSDEWGLTKLWGVEMRALDELGETQEFQTYYTDSLGGTMSASKLEVAVGLDVSRPDGFVNPYKKDMQLFEDPTYHRQRQASFYGWSNEGFSVVNSTRVLLLGI